MTALAACLSVCLLLGPTVPPPADQPAFAPPLRTQSAGYTRSAPTPASELLFRRESARAQQRVARIEARKWQGRSALRPVLPSGVPLAQPHSWGYPAWERPTLRISFNGPMW